MYFNTQTLSGETAFKTTATSRSSIQWSYWSEEWAVEANCWIPKHGDTSLVSVRPYRRPQRHIPTLANLLCQYVSFLETKPDECACRSFCLCMKMRLCVFVCVVTEAALILYWFVLGLVLIHKNRRKKEIAALLIIQRLCTCFSTTCPCFRVNLMYLHDSGHCFFRFKIHRRSQLPPPSFPMLCFVSLSHCSLPPSVFLAPSLALVASLPLVSTK